MSLTSYLAVLAVIVASASAADYNVTSPTQDYFLLSQRKLQGDIYVSELKIASLDTRGADSIKYIGDMNEVVLKEIERVDDSLVPVQALSAVRKHCVQKYKPLLVSYDVARKQLDTCKSSAQTRVNSLTSSPKSMLNNAKVAVNTNLPKAIANCNTTYAQNQTKLEDCVMTNVETYTKTVQGYFVSIDKYLETGSCTLFDLTRDANRCTFATTKTALVTIGSVLDLIDNCIVQQEEPCACANATAASFQEGSVRNKIFGA